MKTARVSHGAQRQMSKYVHAEISRGSHEILAPPDTATTDTYQAHERTRARTWPQSFHAPPPEDATAQSQSSLL